MHIDISEVEQGATLRYRTDDGRQGMVAVPAGEDRDTVIADLLKNYQAGSHKIRYWDGTVLTGTWTWRTPW